MAMESYAGIPCGCAGLAACLPLFAGGRCCRGLVTAEGAAATVAALLVRALPTAPRDGPVGDRCAPVASLSFCSRAGWRGGGGGGVSTSPIRLLSGAGDSHSSEASADAAESVGRVEMGDGLSRAPA